MNDGGDGQVRIGIIGAGFARTTQIPGFRACAGARIVAIASRHRENAERVAAEFGIEGVAGDWREIVAREDVDLISIVTPPSTHMEMALAGLDAGKAVLCEKPMAMNAEEADAMRRRVTERDAFALLDHELRFVAARRRMHQLLRDGDIGRVRHVKLTYRVDSRASAGRPWNWWSEKSAGGGVLGAIGSHAIDGFSWLLGVQASQVLCQLATHIHERRDSETGKPRAVTTDDEANLLLRFHDGELTEGATGAVSLSMVEAGSPEHRLEIFGSEGALMLRGADDLRRASVGDGRWTALEVEREELAEGMRDSEWSRGFTTLARLVVRALREREREAIADAATFEDGYRTQLVLDAARRSHEHGCWTSIESA